MSTETTWLMNADRQVIWMPKSDVDKMSALFKKHKGNIWAAYEEDSKLFTSIVPLWAHAGVPVNGDAHLTNEQAKIIFPLFVQDTYWDLRKFPNLTSECLEYLPKQVTWLTMPQKTDCAHFKYLPRLEKLKDLFVYDRFKCSEGDLKHLRELPLDRIHMPLLDKSVRIAAIFPKTLTTVTLYGGELSDEHLEEYLKENGSTLTYLSLGSIRSVTAKPFALVAKLKMEKIFVTNCFDIDRTEFNSTFTEKSKPEVTYRIIPTGVESKRS